MGACDEPWRLRGALPAWTDWDALTRPRASSCGPADHLQWQPVVRGAPSNWGQDGALGMGALGLWEAAAAAVHCGRSLPM